MELRELNSSNIQESCNNKHSISGRKSSGIEKDGLTISTNDRMQAQAELSSINSLQKMSSKLKTS
jgi:hypothetical protein